ncbi:hypothetical protein N644_1104 [Lactiplantibacillus paraplantarum]|nr:hypothetical protein N644_1104 [Lactiplantibacillus paraplantarum]
MIVPSVNWIEQVKTSCSGLLLSLQFFVGTVLEMITMLSINDDEKTCLVK